MWFFEFMFGSNEKALLFIAGVVIVIAVSLALINQKQKTPADSPMKIMAMYAFSYIFALCVSVTVGFLIKRYVTPWLLMKFVPETPFTPDTNNIADIMADMIGLAKLMNLADRFKVYLCEIPPYVVLFGSLICSFWGIIKIADGTMRHYNRVSILWFNMVNKTCEFIDFIEDYTVWGGYIFDISGRLKLCLISTIYWVVVVTIVTAILDIIIWLALTIFLGFFALVFLVMLAFMPVTTGMYKDVKKDFMKK